MRRRSNPGVSVFLFEALGVDFAASDSAIEGRKSLISVSECPRDTKVKSRCERFAFRYLYKKRIFCFFMRKQAQIASENIFTSIVMLAGGALFLYIIIVFLSSGIIGSIFSAFSVFGAFGGLLSILFILMIIEGIREAIFGGGGR